MAGCRRPCAACRYAVKNAVDPPTSQAHAGRMHDSIIAVDRHGQLIGWDEPDGTRTTVALGFDHGQQARLRSRGVEPWTWAGRPVASTVEALLHAAEGLPAPSARFPKSDVQWVADEVELVRLMAEAACHHDPRARWAEDR